MAGRRRSCRRWSELFYHRLAAVVEHHDGGILEGRPFNREVEGQAEGVPQAALIELAAADGDVGQLPVVVADGLAVVLCFVGLACLLEQVLQGYGILEYAAILVVCQSERGNKDRVYCHPNIICGSESPIYKENCKLYRQKSIDYGRFGGKVCKISNHRGRFCRRSTTWGGKTCVNSSTHQLRTLVSLILTVNQQES